VQRKIFVPNREEETGNKESYILWGFIIYRPALEEANEI
jgi:hypothetical protein